MEQVVGKVWVHHLKNDVQGQNGISVYFYLILWYILLLKIYKLL
jgi:hypothetical protein